MNPTNIIKFAETGALPEEYFLAPEKLISGNPKQTIWQHYTDPSKRFSTGVWQSGPGKWHIAYTEEEYCHILEGHSIITDAQGQSVAVTRGESFVIPRGFVGTWEVAVTTRKTYALYESGVAL